MKSLQFFFILRLLRLDEDKILTKIAHLAHDSIVLFVNRSLLPTRQHDDEVELADTFLRRTLRLHFTESLEEVLVLVLLPLLHQLEVLCLV